MEFWMRLPPVVQALLATGFTYLMTALGASVVFFSNKFSKPLLNGMQGFAAGIMIAASFFSLLLPAQERLTEAGSGTAAIAAVLSVGFLMGGAFIVFSSFVLSRFKAFSGERERGGALMFFAMTLHNIPEGSASRSVRLPATMVRGLRRSCWRSASVYKISPRGCASPCPSAIGACGRGKHF